MTVRPIAENTYRVSAVVKVKGKTFKKVRESFIGTGLAAKRLEDKLKQQCKKAANQYREELEHPYETLARLIDLYIEIKKPSDISTFRRLKDDCGTYEINPIALKSKFLGGADELGNPQKGYVQLLDYEHARRYQRNGTGGEVIETTRLIGANTKNKIYRAIRNLCEFAVEQELLKFNPIQQKIHWKEIPRSRTLSDDEIQKIIGVFTQRYPHYLPLFLHCSRNPCRIGDIRELTRDNLFLDKRQIRYTSSKKKIPVVHIIYDDQVEYFQKLPEESKYLFTVPSLTNRQAKQNIRRLATLRKRGSVYLRNPI